MGLDISAYERVTFVMTREDAPEDYDPYPDHVTYLGNPYPEFAARGDEFADGWYRHEGKVHGFHAGRSGPTRTRGRSWN